MTFDATERQWDRDLEEPALTIAGTNESPLRVCAGPGTGKTFALKRRVVRLLEEGADPQRILAIAFTRNAAHDLARDIQALAVRGADQVESSTLHSFCFKMLAKASVFQFTGRVARPLLDFEKRFLLEDLKIPKVRSVPVCDAMLLAFEASWARLQHEEPGWPTEPNQQDFHQDMMGWLRFHRAMLLGELPSLALGFLKNNPETPERRAFDHVLVDEYQDLNRADQDVIDLLAEGGSLTIIGDEDQSIYGTFRHAQPEGIRDFANTHAGTLNATLDVCWRCPPKVIDMANQLIGVNQGREPRRLIPHEPDRDGFVKVVQWSTMADEAEGLAEFIRLYLAQHPDTKPEEVLVMSPRRVQGVPIREALSERGIQAVSYYFEDAFKPEITQERYSLLNLSVHPDDRVSLRCWLGFGSPSRSAAGYKRLRQYCEANDVNPFLALAELAAGTISIPYTQPLVARWQLLQEQLESLRTITGDALIDAVFPPDVSESEELRAIAIELQENSITEITPQELHAAIVNRIINPEPPEIEGYVRIMSAYKAKGLTVKVAIMASTIESWLPSFGRHVEHLSQQELSRREEEQRRLFYVAMTRPTEALIISSFLNMSEEMVYRTNATARFYRFGSGAGLASRYVSELGATAPTPIRGATLLAQMAQ